MGGTDTEYVDQYGNKQINQERGQIERKKPISLLVLAGGCSSWRTRWAGGSYSPSSGGSWRPGGGALAGG